MSNPTPSHLTNIELTEELIRLARSGRDTTVRLVTHLAEFEARDLHLAAGFPSLFAYCTEVLHLSEHEAYHRIFAARTARRYPRILTMLADGSLTLTTVRLVAPHLTDATAERLLAATAGRSKRQVEEVVAAHAPQPDVPSSIRKVPARSLPAAPVRFSAGEASTPVASPVSVQAPEPLATSSPALVRPLAPARYEVRFTASAETCAKLKRAQDLLRHAIPSGDMAAVVDRALTVLVADLERRKLGATDRPRRRRTSDSRHATAEVKRAVSQRDANCCAFVSKEGRRCGERGFLEFHHVIPAAMGGEFTVENIQLRCRAHNGYEADLFYGKGPQWDGAEVVRESRPAYGATRSGPSSGATDGRRLRAVVRRRDRGRLHDRMPAGHR
jgi:hypothetical protein